MLLNVIAASALALTGPTAVLDVPAATPGQKITVEVVTVMGSGCPAGTAAVAVSPDNTAFTVTYSEYVAQVGPGLSITEGRKNCQLNLKVNVPGGFTYAIDQTDYRGYAELAPGASAVERANYYFQGMSTTQSVTHTINGPLSGDWQATDTVAIAALVWHPCGEQRNLNVNTELRVSKGTSGDNATSYITMDSTDGAINTVYHLQWKNC